MKKGALVELLVTVAIALAMLGGFIWLLLTPAEAAEPNYDALYDAAEQEFKLPEGLVAAICETESNGNPRARGAHGEIGLCQMKPDTLRHFCPECLAVHPPMVAGAVSVDVARVQAKLSYLKLYTGDVDGQFGSLTQQAILAFQKVRKLKVDGIVGPQTWTALFDEPWPSGKAEKLLLDPNFNVFAAARYLKWLSEMLGTKDRMVLAAAYNGGPGNRVVKYMLKVWNNHPPTDAVMESLYHYPPDASQF